MVTVAAASPAFALSSVDLSVSITGIASGARFEGGDSLTFDVVLANKRSEAVPAGATMIVTLSAEGRGVGGSTVPIDGLRYVWEFYAPNEDIGGRPLQIDNDDWAGRFAVILPEILAAEQVTFPFTMPRLSASEHPDDGDGSFSVPGLREVILTLSAQVLPPAGEQDSVSTNDLAQVSNLVLNWPQPWDV